MFFTPSIREAITTNFSGHVLKPSTKKSVDVSAKKIDFHFLDALPSVSLYCGGIVYSPMQNMEDIYKRFNVHHFKPGPLYV